MICQRHKERKRPNSCPDCAAELNKKPNKETLEAMKESKEIVVQKTSREMLAELTKMEQEEEELVIKKERKKKEKVVKEVEGVEEKEQQLTEDSSGFVTTSVSLDSYFSVIDNYFLEKEKEFKKKIESLCNIKYETIYVPIDQFDIKSMDKLNKEGWKLINFWDMNIAKASGIKKEVAVLDRIVNSNNKPKPEYKL